MTPYNGPQTVADDVWPPSVEHPTGFVPAITPDTKQWDLRRGRFALFSALTGIGLPALTWSILMLLMRPVNSATLQIENFLSDASLVVCLFGTACGVAAVVTGIIARKTRTGQWGMAIPLLALSVTVALVLLQHHMNGTWPWQGFSDDCGCDGSG